MATSKSGDKPVKPAAKSAAKSAKSPAAKAKVASASVAKDATPKPVKKVSAPKPATEKKAPARSKSAVSALVPEKRRFYVEVAAYYIAERRGFHGGSQLNDWVEAEKEIDRLLEEGILKP